MIDVEITNNAKNKARKYQVAKKLDKQVRFLKTNTKHRSLDYKPMQSLKGVWRFRVNDHYWGLTIKDVNKPNTLIVYDVFKHP